MDNTDAGDEVSSRYINGWNHCIFARAGLFEYFPEIQDISLLFSVEFYCCIPKSLFICVLFW
jgi:hypothetical protein